MAATVACHDPAVNQTVSIDSQPSLSQAVDQRVEEIMAAERIPGAAVVLVKDGQLVLLRGYGLANVAEGSTVDPEKTIFRIGSISKSLTALALTRLVDQGLLDMDTTVDQFFPELRNAADSEEANEPILIEHLLTHTAGLDQIGTGRHIGSLDRSLAERSAMRPSLTSFLNANNLRRTSPPGQHYRYDTYAITLAGAIMEQVTKLSYTEAMHQQLFEPLGMTRSSVAFDAGRPDDMAVGHGIVDDQYAQAPLEIYVTQPASSINSTPADMARLLQALTQPESSSEKHRPWLSLQMLRAVRSPQYRPHPVFPGVTHGLNEYHLMDVAANKPIRAVGHGGSMLGFQSSLTLIPEINLGIAIFTNRNAEAGGGAVTLHDQVNRLIVSSFFDGERFEGFAVGAPDTNRDLSEYPGDYYYGVFCRTCSQEEFDSGAWSRGPADRIELYRGYLRLRSHNYYPTKDRDVFIREDGQNKIAFQRDRQGSIDSFSFYTSPDTFERDRP